MYYLYYIYYLNKIQRVNSKIEQTYYFTNEIKIVMLNYNKQ